MNKKSFLKNPILVLREKWRSFDKRKLIFYVLIMLILFGFYYYKKFDSIHMAARAGSTLHIEYFLKNGADINKPDVLFNKTALHFAVEYGNFDSAEFLLNKGAAVNAVDSDGKTPLHYAVKLGSSSLVELLKLHGAE
ncbi:MAG: ankyrin repeat domain-containing protein [bacterium]|nr:ankyrin repeat domain-containing protein [bacterium]